MGDPAETAPRAEPAFVLVRPQMGENIGAAARAMANFGLSRLRIVGPRDGWPNPKAVAMASGAGRLLDGAMLTDDLPSAISDCHLVLATTARPRGLLKDVMAPEAAMALARERISAGQRIAVLFGPERAGLENDDVALANAVVTVPVSPDFPSLNLAQCVLLMAYEWRRTGLPPEPDAPRQLATGEEVEALARNWEARLDEAGFFFPPDKAANMKVNLRNLWSRMPLTSVDARILHGALRQLVRRR